MLKNVTQALLSQLILTMDKKLLKKKCNLDSFVTSLGSANSIFVKNFNFQALNFLRFLWEADVLRVKFVCYELA